MAGWCGGATTAAGIRGTDRARALLEEWGFGGESEAAEEPGPEVPEAPTD